MLLQRYGMDEILGLRELEWRSSNLSLEVTEGNANIIMVAGAVPTDSLIEALWILGVDDNDRCYCREYCLNTSGDYTGSEHGCG